MRRKTTVFGLIGLLVIGAAAGSYAYWNQTSTVENPFETDRYGSTITEDFKPEDGENWKPGAEVNKDVFARNTGEQDLIVRARLDETWTRRDDPTTPVNETELYKDSANDPYDVYTVYQESPDDGLTAADSSVVTKNFAASANWIKGADGWYYYKINLPAGKATDKWLDSVTLIGDADMGKMETNHYVSASTGTNEANWRWFPYTGKMPAYIKADGTPCKKGDPGAQQVLHNKVETRYTSPAEMGYSASDYNLKVTLQTVQPTKEAIDAVFGGGAPFTAPAGTSWKLD